MLALLSPSFLSCLLSAYCLLPALFCLLPTAYCVAPFLPTAVVKLYAPARVWYNARMRDFPDLGDWRDLVAILAIVLVAFLVAWLAG